MKSCLRFFCCYKDNTITQPSNIKKLRPRTKDEIDLLLKFAKVNSSTNIFFLFAVNDFICHEDNITIKKLRIFQDVFLSYKKEREKKNEDKENFENNTEFQWSSVFLVNIDEPSVDKLNKYIDDFIDKNINSHDLKNVDKKGLLKYLKEICAPLLIETNHDFQSYQLAQKQNSNNLNMNNRFSRALTKRRNTLDISNEELKKLAHERQLTYNESHAAVEYLKTVGYDFDLNESDSYKTLFVLAEYSEKKTKAYKKN